MSDYYKISDAKLNELETAARRVLAVVQSIRRSRPVAKPVRMTLAGETFGDRLAQARKAQGLKQFELAARAAMSPAQLCQIERGNVTPSIEMAQRLADALGVRATDIMGY